MRPTKDQWAMEMAEVTAKRATCPRRQVGAVILDEKGYVLSTGFNGVPSGFAHCTEHPCAGSALPSGTGLDACMALHAEANAIARLKEPFKAEVAYVTTAPCVSCTKLLLATSIKRVVFKSDYPSSGRDLWLIAGRQWDKL